MVDSPGNWVKNVLKGVKFVMEVVNFTMFIGEETCQTSAMAVSTAIDRQDFDLARKILHECFIPAYVEVGTMDLQYGIRVSPSFKAYINFYRACISQGNFLESQIVKKELEVKTQQGN